MLLFYHTIYFIINYKLCLNFEIYVYLNFKITVLRFYFIFRPCCTQKERERKKKKKTLISSIIYEICVLFPINICCARVLDLWNVGINNRKTRVLYSSSFNYSQLFFLQPTKFICCKNFDLDGWITQVVPLMPHTRDTWQNCRSIL